jgi:hypothetical protein
MIQAPILIYVDQLVTAIPGQYKSLDAFAVGERNGHRWCHLWTDGPIEELHAFAARIGLRRGRFHARSRIQHYDLAPLKRDLALKASAGVSRPLAAPIRQGPPLLWRGSKLMSTIYP